MKALKDEFFNLDFYNNLTQAIKKNFAALDEQKFHDSLINNYQSLELMDRMKHCAVTMYQYLPNDYSSALKIILKTGTQFTGFVGLIFPHFVVSYGMQQYQLSIDALQKLTVYSSGEFAIRPFLKEFPVASVKTMELWSKNKNEHVRRLSCEGLRPLLPWSFKLSPYLDYPMVSTKILTNLNNDESLYVRKSVGNHLNDLTKNYPEYVLDLIKTWDSSQEHTAWIIKKGLRTLIKNGDKRVFKFLGYPKPTNISIDNIHIENDVIKIGETTFFSFKVKNNSQEATPIIIDYIIYYVKKSGKQTPKVFKLRETKIQRDSTMVLSKKIALKQLSTRTHYSGEHQLEIQINGESKALTSFILKD